MKATLFPVKGQPIEVEPANGTDFQLAELYSHLECDMIQVVPVPPKDDVPMIMIVDEEGKFRGDIRDTYNPAATFVAMPPVPMGEREDPTYPRMRESTPCTRGTSSASGCKCGFAV